MFTEQKIEVETKTDNMIEVPTLFRIELNNKFSYLLGSDHRTQLNKLPEICLEAIDQCRDFVMEESEEGFEDYYGRLIYQKAPYVPWTQNLPASLKEKMMQYFNAGVKVILPYQGDIDIDTLEIWAAYVFMGQGYIFLNLEKDSLDHESTDEVSVEECMDHELNRKFTKLNGKTHGLETMAESIWDSKCDAKRFTESLKAGNYELAEAALPDHCSAQEEEEYFKKLGNGDFSNGIKACYKKGLFLYDYHLAKLMDDDFQLTLRTRNWLPHFIHFHQTLLSPVLYVVGAAHLFGQKGLLSLLPEMIKGLEISYLGPQGFKPYKSPFNYNNVSNHLIERALAVERMLNLTTAKEILQEAQQGKPRMIWLRELAASTQNHNRPDVQQSKASNFPLIPYTARQRPQAKRSSTG